METTLNDLIEKMMTDERASEPSVEPNPYSTSEEMPPWGQEEEVRRNNVRYLARQLLIAHTEHGGMTTQAPMWLSLACHYVAAQHVRIEEMMDGPDFAHLLANPYGSKEDFEQAFLDTMSRVETALEEKSQQPVLVSVVSLADILSGRVGFRMRPAEE